MNKGLSLIPSEISAGPFVINGTFYDNLELNYSDNRTQSTQKDYLGIPLETIIQPNSTTFPESEQSAYGCDNTFPVYNDTSPF